MGRPRIPRSPNFVPDFARAAQQPAADPHAAPPLRDEAINVESSPREDDQFWYIPKGKFPMFPIEKGFNRIEKKFGRIGGMFIAKQIDGKFRDEMRKMPDGRIDAAPYDPETFGPKQLEEMYGPGIYRVTLVTDLSMGQANEIWKNHIEIKGGEVCPFPCIIPPSEQGFDPEYDDDIELNPNRPNNPHADRDRDRDRERERERPSPFSSGSGAMFDTTPSYPAPQNPFMNRPMFNTESNEEDSEKKTNSTIALIGAVGTIVAPILGTLMTSWQESQRHQRELDRQRMERDEDRRKFEMEERRKERQRELDIEEEREKRRADDRRIRLEEERKRIEWEEDRTRRELERRRQEEDYQDRKRTEQLEREARMDQEREALKKAHMDPQIAAALEALKSQSAVLQKSPLAQFREYAKEINEARQELENLGMAGGAAPQTEAGLAGFLGQVMAHIPPERLGAIVQTVGSALGMIPPNAAPTTISLTG